METTTRRQIGSRVKCRTLPVTQPSKVDIVISVNDTNRDAKKSYDVLDTLTITSGFEFKVRRTNAVNAGLVLKNQ
ncbi:hypothetical protein V5799_019013 [Amblyomma americanum]|uniref:Uncharacterized protein n=1 Tax=Amblyomma americanum TaxID=6943 RepID=A0AAQ4EXQ6_AMBAM